MKEMSWFEDNVGKVVAVSVAIVISIFTIGFWLTSTTGNEPETNSSVTQTTVDLPEPGVPSRDPRTGKLPSEFLLQFVEKLNEVNSYLKAKNLTESETKDLYRQMWEWADLGGLTLKGLNERGEVQVTSAINAKPTPLIDITTLEGDRFCAVAVELVDPSRTGEGTQVLVAEVCANLIKN
jgi:hypothetical protein